MRLPNSKFLNVLTQIKLISICLLLLTSKLVIAECKSELPISGAISIKNCDAKSELCTPANEAIYSYIEAIKDQPTELIISLQSSPWHLYGPDMRIITIDEIAEMAKPSIKKGVKKIVLNASWSGVAPSRDEKSIAKKLSERLDNFPVAGSDGFLWLSKDGTTYTTKQALTMRQGRKPYTVVKDGDVMVALAAGWIINLERAFMKDKDAEGLLNVAAGLDIFGLCPDRALSVFEESAKLSNPIAGYNAAIIHLERNTKVDTVAAIRLLSEAGKLGDKKSQAKLNDLQNSNK